MEKDEGADGDAGRKWPKRERRRPENTEDERILTTPSPPGRMTTFNTEQFNNYVTRTTVICYDRLVYLNMVIKI